MMLRGIVCIRELASACAIALKRVDVLACLATFPLLRVINSAILLKTFWLEIVRRRHAPEWFTVARYDDSATPRQ